MPGKRSSSKKTIRKSKKCSNGKKRNRVTKRCRCRKVCK